MNYSGLESESKASFFKTSSDASIKLYGFFYFGSRFILLKVFDLPLFWNLVDWLSFDKANNRFAFVSPWLAKDLSRISCFVGPIGFNTDFDGPLSCPKEFTLVFRVPISFNWLLSCNFKLPRFFEDEELTLLVIGLISTYPCSSFSLVFINL